VYIDFEVKELIPGDFQILEGSFEINHVPVDAT
jgi:hypothetical protein